MIPKLSDFPQDSEFLELRAQAIEVIRDSEPLDVRVRSLLIESVANGSRGMSVRALRGIAAEKGKRYEAGRAVGLGWRNFINCRNAEFFVVRLVRDSSHGLDDDNLASAFKAVRDGIADALGLSDRDPCVRYVVDEFKGGATAIVWFALYMQPGDEPFPTLPSPRAKQRKLGKGQRQRRIGGPIVQNIRSAR